MFQRYTTRMRRSGIQAFCIALHFALLCLGMNSAATAARAETFPALTGAVVDNAHILSDATHRTLINELFQLHNRTGHSVVVVTVASLGGRDIAAYGIDLFRTWQLGRKGLNDGAILLIAPNEHRDRIEVGYGLEGVLTDAQSSLILRDAVHPHLAAGDYDGAALAGERAIAGVVTTTTFDRKPLPPKSHAIGLVEEILFGVMASVVALVLRLVLGMVIDAVRRPRRHRSGWGSGSGTDIVVGSSFESSGSSDSSSASSFDAGGSAGGGGSSDSW